MSKLLVVLIACLLASSIGFKNYVWFLSVGYGLAIAAGGFVILFLFKMNWLSFFQCAVLLFYGLRLGIFLLKRELTNKNYKKVVNLEEKKIPLFVSIVMWIAVAALYTMQVSPVFFRLYNGSTDIAVPFIGALISLAGAVIEALADYQKSEQKKSDPKAVAMKGLYRWCRCPNYFGELLMWFGVLIGGITTYKGFFQIFCAVFSFICICYIMFDGAKRLEKRQKARYGDDPVFAKYCSTTPILIPFVPIYHLVKEEKK